jgi:hypothetical protein
MPNRSNRRAKRRRDVKRLAKAIGNISIGEAPRHDAPSVGEGTNTTAVAIGRLSERKGGKARAKKLGKAKLSAIVKKMEYARRNRGN